MQLNKYDLQWCIRRLPHSLRQALKHNELCVAGGYIRACIAKETVNDIDLFVHSKEYGKELAMALAEDNEKRLIQTDNAITIKGLKYSTQIITRWVYDNPGQVLDSFDFTICQAVFWWDHYCHKWCSSCTESFYQDLAAKRLIYTNPKREEEPGGSMLRVLKYYQRGYRISLRSLADVITRLAHGVDFGGMMTGGIEDGELNQPQFSKVIRGLLYEVDPNIDPDHIFDEDED